MFIDTIFSIYVFHQVDFITVNFKRGLFCILCLFGIWNYVIHTTYIFTSFKPIKLSQKMPVYTNILRDNFPVIHLVYFITVWYSYQLKWPLPCMNLPKITCLGFVCQTGRNCGMAKIILTGMCKVCEICPFF